MFYSPISHLQTPNSSRTKRGFTLIELLIVIAIIGILAGIVMANFSSARQKSRDAKRISDLNQIRVALELYFDRCRQYPPSNGNWTTMTFTINSSANCMTGVNMGTFIPQIPTPPAGGPGKSSYQYIDNVDTKYGGAYSTTGNTRTDYVLMTQLENPANIPTDALPKTQIHTVDWFRYYNTLGNPPAPAQGGNPVFSCDPANPFNGVNTPNAYCLGPAK